MVIKDNFIPSIIAHADKDRTNLLLVAEKSKINIDHLLEEAKREKLKIAGGIFPMIISEESHLEEGIILKTINAVCEPFIAKNISQGELDIDLPQLSDQAKSCLLLVDGLMSNIPRFLERLYEKYWFKVTYIGAGCGSLSLKQTPCVFNNEGIYQDAGLVILIQDHTKLGVKHGWEKISGPYVANRTEGNKIIELNWKPAFDVYRDAIEQNLGQKIDWSDFFSVSKGFPFGIFKEGKEDIVRDPIAVEEDGSLICVGNVSQNVALNILKGDSQTLIENARRAAREADLNGLSDLFIVDCISRVLYLEDAFDDELKAVKTVLKQKGIINDLEGVLSIGEISSGEGGYLELYNKTIVISAFSNGTNR
jgi:hypothetical protein